MGQIFDLTTLKLADIIRLAWGNDSFYCMVKECTIATDAGKQNYLPNYTSSESKKMINETEYRDLSLIELRDGTSNRGMTIPTKTDDMFTPLVSHGYPDINFAFFTASLDEVKIHLAKEESSIIGHTFSLALKKANETQEKYRETLAAVLRIVKN